MAAKNYRSELVGVLGYPVAENPTVVMMEAAFRALGMEWRYLTIEVKPEALADAFRGMRAFGMRGINLTIPHKIEAMKYLDEIADDARLIGAVNTVVAKDGRLRGENTDGKGFIASLTEEAGATIQGASILILGAGGAARSIAVELALHGATRMIIANRTVAKAEELAATVSRATGCLARPLVWNGTIAVPADISILVNATSIGLYPAVDARPDLDYATIRPDMIVCDVIPNPPRSAFLTEATRRGAKTLDGLGMLVNQGVIGFRHWTGMEAPAEVMRAALAAEFSD